MEGRSVVPSKRRRGGDLTYHSNTASGNSRVQYGDHYGDTTYNITYHEQDIPDPRAQILASLSFDSMDARQDSIKGAAPGTLDWIYERQHSADVGGTPSEGSAQEMDWDSLATWLEEESSTYWVCGNAGTGKSTLMAHIVDDDRTAQCLSTWAQTKKLHILSFFFWRPGTELQKTINGLLRTLLYQICDDVENAIAVVAGVTKRKRGRPITWTDERLVSAILAALSTTDHKFCIFLDGLDEYEGDVYLLTGLVSQIEALSHVKICVSSRPEVELATCFSGCRQLRLERLNRPDIEHFVQTRLRVHARAAAFRDSWNGKFDRYDRYVEQIVDRADGVFLWIVLVLPALSKGLSSRDSWEMLLARLESMPTGMKDLYTTIFSKVDREHRISLGFYLHVKRLCKESNVELNIAQLAAATIGNRNSVTAHQFHQACDDEMHRVTSQSAGLLHVIEQEPDEHYPEYFEIPTLRAGRCSQDTCPTDTIAAARLRVARPDYASDLTFQRDENCLVEWIHRSAHEFVFPVDGTESPIHNILAGLEDTEAMYRRFLLGCLKMLAFGPSHGNRVIVTVSRLRLNVLLHICANVFDKYPALASDILDQARLIVAEMSPAEFPNSKLLEIYERHSGAVINTAPFWEELINLGDWRIIEHQLPQLIAVSAINALLLPLLWLELQLSRKECSSLCHILAKAISHNIGKQIAEKTTSSTHLYFDDSDFDTLDYKWTSDINSTHTSCFLPNVTNASQAVEMIYLARICAQMLETMGSSSAPSPFWYKHIEAIAESVDLHCDLILAESSDMASRPPLKPIRHRLLLQGHYRLMEARSCQAYSLVPILRNQDHLRLVCIPAGRIVISDGSELWRDFGEEIGFFVVKPSVSTSLLLLQDMIQMEGNRGRFIYRIRDWNVVDRWIGLLVDDVWRNTQGLSATQQLFALTCIKVGMRRWPQVGLEDCWGIEGSTSDEMTSDEEGEV